MISGMSDMVSTGELIPARNGALRDPKTGRIVSGANITTKISNDNSIALHRARKEKTEAAIRAAIARGAGTKSSIAAIALGAEVMFSKVLDDEYDLDKRRKAWLSIGRQAGLLTDHVQSVDNSGQSDAIPRETIELIRDTALAIGKLLGTV